MPEEINPYETPALDKFIESKAHDKFCDAQWDKFMESPAFEAIWELWGTTQDFYNEFDVAFMVWLKTQEKN